MSDRMPYRFRAFLREELPRWRAEGLVDERSAEALAQRYLAEPEGTGLALAAIYVLAACLVGAGVISLVAWHWDELPRGLRLGMLGSALVAAHLAGYRMWKVQARRPLLGHAVSLLGTILFGASIGLVAQIFHVSGVWYGAFGAWALGALAAAVILPGLPELGRITRSSRTRRPGRWEPSRSCSPSDRARASSSSYRPAGSRRCSRRRR